jgi:hypothetical protein
MTDRAAANVTRGGSPARSDSMTITLAGPPFSGGRRAVCPSFAATRRNCITKIKILSISLGFRLQTTRHLPTGSSRQPSSRQSITLPAGRTVSRSSRRDDDIGDPLPENTCREIPPGVALPTLSWLPRRSRAGLGRVTILTASPTPGTLQAMFPGGCCAVFLTSGVGIVTHAPGNVVRPSRAAPPRGFSFHRARPRHPAPSTRLLHPGGSHHASG